MMGYAFAALLIASLVGAWIVNDRAYDRGHAAGWADNTAAQKKAIAIKKKIAAENRAELDKLPPDKVDEELKRRCVAGCKEDAQCVKACD